MNTSNDYTWLRQQLLAKRKTLTLLQRHNQSIQLCEILLAFIHRHFPPHSSIAAFWPIGEEVDIKPLLTQLDKEGYKICLPKVIEKNAPLRFYYWTSDAPMGIGHFNIPEPLMTEEVLFMPDLIITPLLGFTRQGDRLGYGKGYYDRTLGHWIRQGLHPYTIGVSWNEGIIEENYQPADHDVPLKNILTPSGWVMDSVD